MGDSVELNVVYLIL